MKKTFLFLTCLLFTFTIFAQDPNFVYAKKMGGKSADRTGFDGMAMDAFKNIYITGTFNDTADFDPNAGVSNLISHGSWDTYVCKLDSNGNLIWVKQFGSIDSDWPYSIVISPSGFLYVVGYVSGTADMDPGTGVANITGIGRIGYVLKLTTSGNFVWVKQFESSSASFTYSAYFQSAILDNAENIYVGGMFGATVDFNPDTTAVNNLTASGDRDMVILKLNSAGQYIWAKKAGSTGDDRINFLTLDAHANVYATGYFSFTVDFNPSPAMANNLTSAGNDDGLVWKLDSAGNYVFAKQFSGSSSVIGEVITLGDSGYIYTAGEYKNTADFDPGPGMYNLSATYNSDDIFLSVLDSTGAYVKAYTFGDSLPDNPYAIWCDAEYNIYLGGTFHGTINFSTDNTAHYTTSGGLLDGFLLKFDKARNFKWLQDFQTASMGQVVPTKILIDARKNIYMCGQYSSTTDFDPGPGTANMTSQSDDIFLVKLSQAFASGFNYSPSLICKNATVSFTNTSTGATSYSWTFQGGSPATSTQQNPSVTFTSSGNKTVTLVAYNGTSTDTTVQVINIKALPTATVTPQGPITFCSGGSVLLSANTGTGLNYSWLKNNITIPGATASSYTAVAAGAYKVNVTNTNGCSSTSSAITVTVNPNPSAAITAGGPVTFCAGDSVILSAPSGTNRTYQWNKNGTNISGATLINYTAKETGTYKVTVTNTGTGCSTTTATGTSVTKNALPSATVTPQGPTTFCAGQSVVLMANSGANLSYQWRKDNINISGANAQSYTAFVAGVCKVGVTNTSTGCTKISAAVTVIVNCRFAEQENVLFSAEMLPNPFKDHITIRLDINEELPVTINVLSADGRLIENKELATGQNQFTIGDEWSSGMYLVRIKQGLKEKTFHIVKQ